MLVLSRKKGESVILQDHIEITILEVSGDTVKIGINAPKDVEILRKELYVSVKESNRESAGLLASLQGLQAKLKNNQKSEGEL